MEQKIEVKATDESYKGFYSNNAVIMHTQTEFIVDFVSIFPPKGLLGARVIMAPSTIKRVLLAMQENISNYEKQHGEIVVSAPPDPNQFKH